MIPARKTLSVAEPLSPDERTRLRELILCVNRGLNSFLEVGRALLEIKSERLYRETHSDFDSYCRDTFGLGRSYVSMIAKSAQTAENLIRNGTSLPLDIAESTIRPLNALPDPDLQTAVWKLVEAVSPTQGRLTTSVTAKVIRTIKNAIASASPNGKGPWQQTHRREYPKAELPFLRPLSRIARWGGDGFDASLVISHVENPERAARIGRDCRILIGRCSMIITEIAERFPR